MSFDSRPLLNFFLKLAFSSFISFISGIYLYVKFYCVNVIAGNLGVGETFIFFLLYLLFFLINIFLLFIPHSTKLISSPSCVLLLLPLSFICHTIYAQYITLQTSRMAHKNCKATKFFSFFFFFCSKNNISLSFVP